MTAPTRKRTLRRPGPAAPLKRQRSTGDGPSVAASAGPGTRGGYRPGAGRPARAGEPAQVRLELLTTQEERAILDAAAESLGLRCGAFARDAALAAGRTALALVEHAGDRVIPLRVRADQYRAIEEYADRLGVTMEDAIRDNVLGQCADCSGPAIMDARPVTLCERCRVRREDAPVVSDEDPPERDD